MAKTEIGQEREGENLCSGHLGRMVGRGNEEEKICGREIGKKEERLERNKRSGLTKRERERRVN